MSKTIAKGLFYAAALLLGPVSGAGLEAGLKRNAREESVPIKAKNHQGEVVFPYKLCLAAS